MNTFSRSRVLSLLMLFVSVGTSFACPPTDAPIAVADIIGYTGRSVSIAVGGSLTFKSYYSYDMDENGSYITESNWYIWRDGETPPSIPTYS